MNETLYLVVTFIKDLVPQTMIESMAQMLFVVTCVTVVLLELSVVMLIGNIASLIDRILPINKAQTENVKQWSLVWPRKLMFWKKTN